MSGGLYLHLDGRRLAVRSGGAGPVLAAYRGLVDATKHDLASRDGRADDGSVAAGQARSAVASLGPRQPQYTSTHFQRLLKEQGITCTMSRAGEAWNNSAMDSFFSSLKTERTARTVYRTREQARSDMFDYIERFYNPMRRHSTWAMSVRYSSRKLKKLKPVSTEPAAAQITGGGYPDYF